MRKLSLLIPLLALLTLAACKKAPPHPNAIDAFDAQAYDSLTAAQASLDEAKAQYAAGTLPTSAKEYINQAGAVYNTARASWTEYRDVAAGLKAGDLISLRAKLTTDTQALLAAIGQLKQIIGGGK